MFVFIVSNVCTFRKSYISFNETRGGCGTFSHGVYDSGVIYGISPMILHFCHIHSHLSFSATPTCHYPYHTYITTYVPTAHGPLLLSLFLPMHDIRHIPCIISHPVIPRPPLPPPGPQFFSLSSVQCCLIAYSRLQQTIVWCTV